MRKPTPAQVLAYLVESLGYKDRLAISGRRLDEFLATVGHRRLCIREKDGRVISYLSPNNPRVG